MEICSPNLVNFDYMALLCGDMHQSVTDALVFYITFIISYLQNLTLKQHTCCVSSLIFVGSDSLDESRTSVILLFSCKL